MIGGTSLLEVVSRQDNRAPALGFLVDDRVNRLRGVDVQARQRFVQQQHRMVLGNSLSNVDPLPLTPGQFGQVTIGQVGDVESLHCLLHALLVLRARPTKQPQGWIAAHTDGFPHGQGSALGDGRVLQHVGDLRLAELRGGTQDTQRSAGNRQEAGDGVQQCRLAGSVRPDDGGNRTLRNNEIRVTKGHPLTTRNDHVLSHDGIRHGRPLEATAGAPDA